jgi:hypothetical protein
VTSERNDYEVGHGRPPKHTQFKKGESGNPRGRVDGSKNLATLIEQALERRVSFTENGRRRTITMREAIAIQLVKRAASGDAKSMNLLINHDRTRAADAERVGQAKPINEELDRAIIMAFLREVRDEPDESANEV